MISAPPLTPDEIHLWHVPLDPPDAHALYLLSPDEHARAARFHFEEHRQRYAAGRAALRLILAAYLALDPAALRFVYGPAGKPALAAVNAPQFNLAHSEARALIAVAHGRRVGVDLERIRPLADQAQVAASVFTAAEQAALAHTGFFRAWCRKEAVLKAWGDGLTIALETVDTTRPLAGWTLIDLDAPPGYAAALAAEGSGWRVRTVSESFCRSSV